MKVKTLKEHLAAFDNEADIAIYDDDNDRVLDIACVAEDEADECGSRIFIFVE